MSSLLVVTGPPGAGKSTVSRRLVERLELSALVPGDAFFGFLAGGYETPWRPAAHRQNSIVLQAAAAAAGRLVAGGYDVVYDGVVGPWFLDEFCLAAGLEELHYALLLPPEAACLERVASRQGHGFNDLQAAGEMYARFAAAEMAPRHLLSGLESADEMAEELARRLSAGSLSYSPGDQR